MTLLGPVFFGAIMIVPLWLKTSASGEGKAVYVLDETGQFTGKLSPMDQLFFSYHQGGLEKSKLEYIQGDYLGLLFIPGTAAQNPSDIVLYSDKKVKLRYKAYIQQSLNERLRELSLEKMFPEAYAEGHLNRNALQLRNLSISQAFEEEKDDLLAALGLFMAVLIYFFILLYGVQVMRGVMEEKSNRIIEVIISSVKPFQLMLGKILGVALVSLLQFLVWIVFTSGIAAYLQARFGKSLQLFNGQNIEQTLNNTDSVKQALEVHEVVNALAGVDAGMLMAVFMYFFIGGYLLYGALFAAIGSAADSETDLQQFVLPVTIPLFVSFMLISTVVENPQGQLACWLSMIPFTSPVIMMARIPYGVPHAELFLSMGLLFLTFIATTWMASRIYRTGILMHGKKISYTELVRWLFNKERP